MTTVTRERTEWDAFLLEDVEREYPNATQRETELESRLKQVEGFRKQEWQSIRGQLKRDYNWVVLVEPHWTTSGSAIFWQRQTVEILMGNLPSLRLRRVGTLRGRSQPTTPVK